MFLTISIEKCPGGKGYVINLREGREGEGEIILAMDREVMNLREIRDRAEILKNFLRVLRNPQVEVRMSDKIE